MPAPDLIGFTRSAVWRLAGAGAYILVVGALLMAVEARGAGRLVAPALRVPVPAPAPAAPLSATLTLSSTYAVARWTVELDGVAQQPSATSAQGWQGRVRLPARSAEIFIHGEAADPLAAGPCALRIAVAEDGQPERTLVLWGAGAVAARVAPLALPGGGR